MQDIIRKARKARDKKYKREEVIKMMSYLGCDTHVINNICGLLVKEPPK